MKRVEIEQIPLPKIEPIYFGPNYRKEIEPPKNGEAPLRGLAVLISGGPGTGTTTLAKELGGAWGLPAGTKKRIGAGDRLRAQTKDPIIGYAQRPLERDKENDRRTRRSIRKTLPGRAKIIESRLAGILGIEGRKRADEFGIESYPDVFTILLWAPDPVVIERGFQRDSKKYPQLNLTKNQYGKLQKERYVGDLNQFRKAHPGLLDNCDPLDPTDPWSLANYDLIINTAELRAEEIVTLIQLAIREKKADVEKGKLIYLKDHFNGDDPEETVIFNKAA